MVELDMDINTKYPLLLEGYLVCPIMDVIPIIHCGDEHEYRLKNFIPLNLTGMV